jgi:hypothetical protein
MMIKYILFSLIISGCYNYFYCFDKNIYNSKQSTGVTVLKNEINLIKI